MQFSPHETRNVAERFVSLIPKVCTGALFFYVGHFLVTFNDYPTQATEPRALKTRDHRAVVCVICHSRPQISKKVYLLQTASRRARIHDCEEIG